MPEQPPVTANIAATNGEVVIAGPTPAAGVLGPVNVDNPNAPGVLPTVIIRFTYQFTWGATTTTLTLRCRRNSLTGTLVTLPGGGNANKVGPAAANFDVLHVEWVDTNVPEGTVYVITGQTGTAAVTAAAAVLSTNDCT